MLYNTPNYHFALNAFSVYFLNFFQTAYLSTFNITLLLATPECGTIKTKARERWIFSMCIPFMVAVLCLLWGVVSQCWLRCRRKIRAATDSGRIVLQGKVK